MSVRIFISHGPEQVDAASALVDLLEASLDLPPASLSCTYLPGYDGVADARSQAEVVLALFGGDAADLDVAFAAGEARGLGKLLLPVTVGGAKVPRGLTDSTLVQTREKLALMTMVEDLGHHMDCPVRFGGDARDALEQLVGPGGPVAPATVEPPPMPTDLTPVVDAASLLDPQVHKTFEPVVELVQEPTAVVDLDEFEMLAELDEDLLQPDEPPASARASERPTPRYSQPVPKAAPRPSAHLPGFRSCFEMGRSLSDAAFDDSDDQQWTGELIGRFGQFVTALGGDWAVLQRLDDMDVWMETVDNLLANLPLHDQPVGQWYEVGFQLSTMLNLSDHGLTASDEGLEAYTRALEQFCASAQQVGLSQRDLLKMQVRLENLAGPLSLRDYSHVPVLLRQLMEHTGEVADSELARIA